MKTKTSKQPKQSKPGVLLKDIKPKKDARGGRTAGTKSETVAGVDFRP